MERIETTLYLGPPGTGKTTTLINRVKELLAEGIPPNRIAYVSFTRKAAEEARLRVVAATGLSIDDFPHFRTLHSMAYSMLGLQRSEVMSRADYDQLGMALGWAKFEHQYDHTMERCHPMGGLGDRALAICCLARARMCTLEQAWREVGDPELSLVQVERFDQAHTDYKKQVHKLDFMDFMDVCQMELDIDVIIIDEAQDLNAQQWTFVKRAACNAKRVIIAGDDDQCIFSWAGADIQRFLSINANRIVLAQSYRLPRSVWQLADNISSRIGQRYEKEWYPADREGITKGINHAYDEINLNGDQTWLLLARNRAHIPALEKLCEQQGVVYNSYGRESNDREYVKAALTYENLRKGQLQDAKSVERMLRYVYAKDKMPPLPPGGKFGFSDLPWPAQDMMEKAWYDAFVEMQTMEKEYVRRLRANDQPLRGPGKVIISTIHGVKGGEADNVLLASDMSMKVKNEMQKNPDAEHRVWYVGVTRAKHNLYIARNHTNLFYRFR